MTDRAAAAAVRADSNRRAAQCLPELLAQCYRMLASVHDAEDLLQDTLLRAWRAYDRFDERRASMRTWLYRIATNACLTALRSRGRRPLPSGLGGPADDVSVPMTPSPEVAWVEPFPDTLLGADPAAVVAARGQLRLALIAALQLLPARQRAILLLRDVLEWSAAEVAAALDTTPAAVNSGRQRARARLAELGIDEDQVDEPASADQRAVVDRYVTAFVNADLAALATLLTDDVRLEMPPVPTWFVGRDNYVRFFAGVFDRRGTDWRIVATQANGQPAIAAYVRAGAGYRAHSVQLFEVTRAGIAHHTVYLDPAAFVPFNLPADLPERGQVSS